MNSEEDLTVDIGEEAWCDDHLWSIYDVGMFDHKGIYEEIMRRAVDLVRSSSSFDPTPAMTDIIHDWFKRYHDTMIDAIPPVPAETVRALRDRPQVSQHSAEWYAERKNRLTASEFWKILTGSRGALLRQKTGAIAEKEFGGGRTPVAIAQSDGEMVATSWGHRFEPVVRDIYELELAGVGTVCDSMGRFGHKTIPWLSASPDGMVVAGALAGRLVEIKSPKTRQPGDFVPTDYYVQMQIQMEVCDLDAVDFIEAQFGQRPVGALSEGDMAAVAAAAWKGRIEVYGHYSEPDTWVYRYSQPVEDLEDAVFASAVPEGVECLESSVWWLTGWFPRTVMRNRAWWTSVGLPASQAFWAEVEAGRGQNMDTAMAVDDEAGEFVGKGLGGWLGSRS
jgi:hypothetical protein